MWTATVLVGFVVAVLVINHNLVKQEAARLKGAQLEAEFERYLHEIDSFTENQRSKAEALAREGEWLYRLKQGNPQFDAAGEAMNVTMAHISTVLDSAIRGGGLWYEPYILEPGRRWVGPYATVGDDHAAHPTWEYSTDDYHYTRHGWYTNAVPETWDRKTPRSEDSYITEPYLDSLQGRPTSFITFSHLMYSPERAIIGVSTADWTFDSLARTLSRFKITPASFAFLVHTESSKVLFPVPRDRLLRMDETFWGQYVDIKGSSEGRVSQRKDIRVNGKRYDAMFTRAKSGFTFGVFVDADEAYQFLDDLTLRSLIMALITLLVIVLATFVVISRLLKPVRELAMSARRISNGDFDHRATVRGTDEIGDLASAFNDAYSKLRLSEEALRQSQKMEALGRLAGGVAHDFNNALTAVLGFTNLLIRRHADQPDLVKYLKEIENAGEHAAALTKQLLAFSGKHVSQRQPVDLAEVVRRVAGMIQQIIGEDIDLVTDVGEGQTTVLADPRQVEQVLVNLAANARDAMPDGGRLLVSTQRLSIEEPRPMVGGVLPAGDYVLVAVEDTGMGLSAETAEQMFDPFFTTKAAGEGTGLGLATSFRIVHDHGGHMNVVSELGKGCRFEMYWSPAVQQATLQTEIAEDILEGRGEKVLVVEDNEQVRSIVVDVLRSAGYQVFEAGSAMEALRVARLEGRIDALVTDVVMPGMKGPELAEKLAETQKNMAVLFVSGYSAGALSAEATSQPRRAFLQKPFGVDALPRAVRKLLDEPSTVSHPQ